jgi:hypothetical protein
MTFPSSTISTANLDSGTDSPALARADIYSAVVALNTIISEANGIGGVALLDSSGLYDPTKLPAVFSPTGFLTLSPTAAVVNIQDILRLTALPEADITATDAVRGDVAFSSDANSGNAAICFYDGTDWRYLGLSSLPVL